jgi:hypothetical protein
LPVVPNYCGRIYLAEATLGGLAESRALCDAPFASAQAFVI